MIFTDVAALRYALAGVVRFTGDAVTVENPAALRGARIDDAHDGDPRRDAEETLGLVADPAPRAARGGRETSLVRT